MRGLCSSYATASLSVSLCLSLTSTNGSATVKLFLANLHFLNPSVTSCQSTIALFAITWMWFRSSSRHPRSPAA
ncbi:hypothetical protein EDD15DRAFT_2324487 [Pisolithus albus]|nr:hypothetical protein EDD15DRAFT_2324487 [Pisolithus albus]